MKMLLLSSIIIAQLGANTSLFGMDKNFQKPKREITNHRTLQNKLANIDYELIANNQWSTSESYDEFLETYDANNSDNYSLEKQLVCHYLKRYASQSLQASEKKAMHIKLKELKKRNRVDAFFYKNGNFLHYAAQYGDKELIKLLLSLKASTSVKHKSEKKTAQEIALKEQKKYAFYTKEYKTYDDCVYLLSERIKL